MKLNYTICNSIYKQNIIMLFLNSNEEHSIDTNNDRTGEPREIIFSPRYQSQKIKSNECCCKLFCISSIIIIVSIIFIIIIFIIIIPIIF